MTLAIFDLDNTLIAGDSDHQWGEFLVDRGEVDGAGYKAANDRFYQDYLDGTLDIFAYQEFVLSVLKGRDLDELHALRRDFMDQVIDALWLPAAEQLVARHRQQGDTLMIITATNDFITAPIAERLGVPHLIATTAERDERGGYTGRVAGVPSYRDGKVERLNDWLARHGESLDGSWFYSDSHNDLPLLGKVDHPVAVDPDDTLAREARERGWPILSLRETREETSS
ncbi:HAD family hydrolase [Alloalcanivorax sp. C16-1]|uniref:histidinol-phosphatase n=1 Tax=Alloalcanivorax sp. C16-1 TaxID=3390051 RepID=UPI003970CEB3